MERCALGAFSWGNRNYLDPPCLGERAHIGIARGGVMWALGNCAAGFHCLCCSYSGGCAALLYDWLVYCALLDRHNG